MHKCAKLMIIASSLIITNQGKASQQNNEAHEVIQHVLNAWMPCMKAEIAGTRTSQCSKPFNEELGRQLYKIRLLGYMDQGQAAYEAKMVQLKKEANSRPAQ